MKATSSSRELSAVMESAAAVQNHENKQNGSKYGAWGKFVTPKRTSRRSTPASRPSYGMLGDVKEDEYSELYDVVAMALSLLLVWGENAEDIADSVTTDQNVLLQTSPCTLLLSKASLSSIQPHAANAMQNIANLNLISHLASSSEDVFDGGIKCDAVLLSARVIKMCLRHVNVASAMTSVTAPGSIGLTTFRTALGDGRHLFNVLIDAFDKLVGDDASEAYSEGIGRVALLATTLLESISVSVSSQPDLAQAILLGGEGKEDWRLVDKIVSSIMNTSELLTTSREKEGTKENEKMLNLLSVVTCACLKVVSELWNSCRLSVKKNSNTDNVHACGSIVAYLTNPNKTGTSSLVTNLVVELTRCSLLAIMSLEEKNSMLDEVSTSLVNQKCILLDLLSRSLEIISVETVSRVQTKSQGGIKFIEDLYDSGPMECWQVLLTSSDAVSSAASSWLAVFTASVNKSDAPNWNIASFLRANTSEKEVSTSSWCSIGSGTSLARALSSDSNSVSVFRQCNALNVLAQGEASFSASWATLFEIVTANVFLTQPSNEVYELTSVVAETTLSALSSVSASKMLSESMLSSQGLLESSDTKPVGELCSLLLYSLTVKRDIAGGEDARGEPKGILDMIGRLYESANKLFAMTQLGSVSPSKQEGVCLIRQRLLASTLLLMSEYESLSPAERSRNDMVKYNDVRIGFTDLAVNALQSLQYVQLESDENVAVEDDASAPTKYGYGFGSTFANKADVASLGQEASFQLLRTSLTLLSRLAPAMMGPSSNNEYQNYTYGVNFAACLKERSAIHYIQYHLGTASNVASLTYQAVHAGTAQHSVAVIHNNSVDIVRVITTFFHTLTNTGSSVLDVLLLMMDNRCFRSLIDNPLLKTACKTWTSNADTMGDEVISVTRHRGYYTGFPKQVSNKTSSSSKPRACSQRDLVHFIWREAISIFSSLLRAARCQTFGKVDETIAHQLTPVTTTVLDFVCAYEDDLFSCFKSMLNEARAQSIRSSKGRAKSSFSSSIQSASYAFTPNLLSESCAISSLFAELCNGGVKTTFSRQFSGIYKRVISTSAELTKITSSFLGAISNARELFDALACASSITGPSGMYDHPLLAEGVPNAKHEAIRNAHFAHSCCILATANDFTNSHTATTKAAEPSNEKDSSLEQSFQIHVNNMYIAEVESVAGHCLFNALSVLSDTHPASSSFITFTSEEASRLDVAAVITPGITVAISSTSAAAQQSQRYRVQSGGDVQYARVQGCDRSTRTISVEYSDTGVVDRRVPWSWIVGMEDMSKRQTVFSYGPAPKSIAEADTTGPPSLGNLILSLMWSRHTASASLHGSTSCPLSLVKCIAECTALLLCTEVILHNEIRGGASPRDDTSRKVNMQLLDLFECTDTKSAGGLAPAPPALVVPTSSHGSKGFALIIGEDILGSIQKNLHPQLEAASFERQEEAKLWAQNNAGWDTSSFLGSSSKRQGRRSPFRLTRKSSSGDLK